MAFKDWMGTGTDVSEILLKRNTLWNCAMEDFNFPHTNWWTDSRSELHGQGISRNVGSKIYSYKYYMSKKWCWLRLGF